MPRQPPTSTLFPTRRSSDLPGSQGFNPPLAAGDYTFLIQQLGRSEEHTSELQSQSNLVCRLLLEKKKTNRQLRPDGEPVVLNLRQQVADSSFALNGHRTSVH